MRQSHHGTAFPKLNRTIQGSHYTNGTSSMQGQAFRRLDCFSLAPHPRSLKRNVGIAAKAYGLLPATMTVIEPPPLATVGVD